MAGVWLCLLDISHYGCGHLATLSEIPGFKYMYFKAPWLPTWQSVKNLPANAGDTGDSGSIPGLGRSPGGGNGNPLQYSCLGNPTDRGAWWAIVHVVMKRYD